MRAMTEVQNLIAELRAKGWTVAAISDELGVDYYTVYKWEKGIHAPSNIGAVRKVLSQLLQQRRIPKRRRYKRNPSVPKD
jgi:transcriptional regulator with XRE-family HTH domain